MNRIWTIGLTLNHRIVRIIIDTYVLLVSISSKSKYHWLYELILEGKLEIAVSHEILLEYEEQLSAHWHPNVAISLIRSLIKLPTAQKTTVYYYLKIVNADADDNKFVDYNFAVNADYIITNDKHLMS